MRWHVGNQQDCDASTFEEIAGNIDFLTEANAFQHLDQVGVRADRVRPAH